MPLFLTAKVIEDATKRLMESRASIGFINYLIFRRALVLGKSDEVALSLYNFRAGDRTGSIHLDPDLAGASHLLLHTYGNKAEDGLFRIRRKGPRIFSGKQLLEKGYPSDLKPGTNEIYAVYDVEPDKSYTGLTWSFSKLRGRKPGRQSANPFAVSLTDVLAIQRS